MNIPVPHGQLWAEQHGQDGATPIVFVHGFSVDRRLWDAQVAALAPRRRCIVYDLRGFGRSTLPDPAHPFAHYQDLKALLDELGLARVDLVGLSFGGAIAIDCALAYPERVRRLVVLGSTLSGYPYKSDATSPRIAWETGKAQGIAAAKRVWLEGPMFRSSLLAPAAMAKYMEMFEDFSGWQFAHEVPLLRLAPPAATRLETLTQPILALVGERESADLREVAEAIARRAPAGAMRVIANAGHILNLDAPGEVAAAISEFLAVTEAAVSA